MMMCIFISIIVIVVCILKQIPEQAPMEPIETSYPMELVHMDFLVIGSKVGLTKDINVLVITDHFS